jgi:hypothetical protein
MLRKLNFSKVVRITKKVICLGMAIAVSIVGLTACTGDMEDELIGNKVNFEEKSFGGFFNLSYNEKLSTIAYSQEELTLLFEEYNTNWQWSTLIWERYGDEFFESKALLLYFFWATSTDLSFSVNDIRIDGEELKLYLVGSYYGDALNDCMKFVPIVVEVAKTDIGNIRSFSVEHQSKKL